MTTTQDTPAADVATEPPVPRGYWRKANGALIPETKVRAVDKARHALVYDLAERAKAMRALLVDFKTEVDQQIDAFLTLSAAEYDVTMRGSLGKGNITLTSYDGRYKVVRQVADRMAFDERLQIAKQQMDECARRFTKGGSHNAKAVLEVAFQTDKTGKVSVARILDLCRAKIDDEQWLRAVQIVRDSMQVVSSAQYVRCYEINKDGGYDAIPLDAASS